MMATQRWRKATALVPLPRLVAILAALLLAPAAYGQDTEADPPRNVSVNFVTGVATWGANSGDCGGNYWRRYRTSPSASYTSIGGSSSTTTTVTALQNPDYGEFGVSRVNAVGCVLASPYVTVSYTATTLSASPAMLTSANLNGATLTVTLGDNESTRTDATSPETFLATADASHFTLSTTGITGLSVSSVSTTTGSSTATVTLSYPGDGVATGATIAVVVAAAAHSGTNALTSRTVSAQSDYDADDDGLLEIRNLQQLNAVRWDLDGDGTPAAGNATSYRAAFPGSTTGCPATGCTGYELTKHLDFDTDGDGDVDSNDPDTYASWTRIAGTYSAIFDGNGFNIANLTASGSADAALFENVSGTIRWLGLPNVNISTSSSRVAALAHNVTSAGTVIGCWASGSVATTKSTSARAGGLIYQVSGRVAASFTTASVSARTSAGGMADVLFSAGTIVASYATGSVRAGRVGSIVRRSFGTIRASYATGVPTDISPGTRDPNCFIHEQSSATNQYNYCDTDLTGVTTATGATGQTTSAMQTPTSATGIYANWDDLDVNGNGTADEDPWHFGTSSQHPVLKYGTQDPGLQRGGDYDNDDDGLIEIHSLRQLNAIRWDLDGDGTASADAADDYASAFYDRPADMGCPATGCTGYELEDDLDFDTDDDGATHTAGNGDPADAYYNGGTGWEPIGSDTSRFTATLDGNGRVIDNLFVKRTDDTSYTGLFAVTGGSGTITSVGLRNAYVASVADSVGALVGAHVGRIAACWATGAVRGSNDAGGLVGSVFGGAVVASYSRASVAITMGEAGGLAGFVGSGAIRASYSTGAVTGGTRQYGLAEISGGTVAASYWDTELSGIEDDADARPPEGRTSTQLEMPTEYGTTGLYASWDDEDVDGDGVAGEAVDDDAWDFGTSSQHPVLKFGGFDTALQFGLQPAIVIDADAGTTGVDEAGPLALTEQAGTSNSQNYSVRLRTAPSATVTVQITSDDRAVAVDTDMTPQTLTLTFTTANWSTAQTVTATAAQDDDGVDEQASIAHAASGGGYARVTAALGVMTTDDDTPAIVVSATALTTSGVTEGATATYTVVLDTEPDGVAVVAVAPQTAGVVALDMDDAQAGRQSSLSFDAMNWNTARTVTVWGLEDDDGAADPATLQHTASGADYGGAPAVDVAFTVADDDARAAVLNPTTLAVNEGSTATYTAVLSAAPVGGPVTVAATTSAASVATVSPASLMFTAANWNVPQMFRVSGVADVDTTDGAATISNAVSGADFASATPTVSVTVRDSDAAGVRIEPTALTVAEGGSGSYGIRLNTQPTGDVTVTASTATTELALDTDGTPQEVVLTFTTANWDTQQTVQVTAGTDDDPADDTLSVTHAVTGYTGVTTAPALTVQVQDDDVPGLAFAPAAGVQVSEADLAATAQYTVVLTTQPVATVTVTIASDDAGLAFDADSIVLGDQSSMTFTMTNWNTAQTVTVRAVADADVVTETAMLLHTASGGGYNGVSAAYPVRVMDANAPGTPGNVSAASAGPRSLAVSWTAAANATSQLVQWRRTGEAWSATRQLEVAATATSARIDGLATGVRYQVRVLGVNSGHTGEPSAIAEATPAATRANRAPEPAGELAELSLAVGETRTVDVSGAFVDPDGDTLTYTAWSSDESVATASAFGSQLRVRGNGVGLATVMLRAMDPDGLTATRQLRATVGVTLSLTADAEAPEGGTARLMATLSTARATATTFSWRVAADMDAATVDADVGEHGDASGEATIAAGETSAEIAIAIADDDAIEPAREWFDVVLEAPADSCCVVREARARVAVLEGVCDRTPAVADALRRDAACTAPTPATLATRTRLTVAGADTLRAGDFQGLPNLRWLTLSGNALAALPEDVFAGLGLLRELDLSGNALTTLPPEPFSGLSRLRLLDLSGNAFETLPAGLFAGLFLREASLDDNPGAPFPLAAVLTRTDAEQPWAPGPATVEVRLPSGAPFPLRLPLAAEPALETLPATVAIPSGATAAAPFAASAPPASALVLRVRAATLPTATCGDEWPFRACFRGLAPQPSATLTLFRQPPQALPAPEPEPLSGETLRLPLASLIAAGDGTLRWQASSSDASVATVRVVGGDLLVEPEPGAEGTVEIVLVATDAVGLTATVRFTVQVEFFAPTRPNAGWRTALGDLAPQ